MRRTAMGAGLGLALGIAGLGAPGSALDLQAQAVEITDSAITLSGSGRAELWVRTSDGDEHRVSFDGGTVEIDGAAVGDYEREGALVAGWRDFLRERAGADGGAVRAGLLELRARWIELARAGGAEADEARALERGVAEWLDLEVADEPEPDRAQAEGRAVEIAPGTLRFDYTAALARLERALERLGDAGAALEDELAMIVHDDFSVPAGRAIAGDLALLDGTLRLGGEVQGDVLVLDGRLVLADGARIAGDVLQVGGDLSFDGEGAVIGGEILADLPLAPEAPEPPEVAVEAPSVAVTTARRERHRGPFGRFAYNMGRAGSELMEVLSAFGGLALLGLLLVRFGRGRLETVADTVRHDFWRSFAMGVAGSILFFPALLILLVLVITWPIVPFFILAAVLATAAGYVAVAHGAGEMFARRRYRYEWLERLRRSNSYYYVLSGLALLLLPFAVAGALWVLGGMAGVLRSVLAGVAGVATVILVTAGFGAVLLTRGGARSVVVDWGEPEDARFDAAFAGEEMTAEPSADETSDTPPPDPDA